MSLLRSIALGSLLLGVAACSADHVTGTAPTGLAPTTARMDAGSTETSPQFLQPAAGAPTIANPVVQFWAKRGVDRTAEMFYHATPGAKDSVTFFSLRLRARSLWKRPDGSRFADGDSILVTLTLADAERGIVDCEPSGLRFDPKNPVRLRISFAETNGDVNGDGQVNATDAALTQTFAVWRQEMPSAPWIRTTSTVTLGAHEVETEIGGFTSYAIAW